MSSHAEKKDILGAMIPSLLPDRSLLSWKSNIMIHCIASNTIALLCSSSTYYTFKAKIPRYILDRGASEYRAYKKQDCFRPKGCTKFYKIDRGWKLNIMIHCIASNTIAILRSSSIP